MQHWRFLVITSEEGKNKLYPIVYHQNQVVEASATVVILGDQEANKTAEEVFEGALQAGSLTKEVHDSILRSIHAAYEDIQSARNHAYLNASLAAMQLMLIAKAKGYDTCPMAGFYPEALINECNIPDRFVPIMLISIGKAAHTPRVSEALTL